MELIQTVTLGTASPSLTFSSIPATFDDLSLVISARSSAGGGTKGLEIGFNGAFTNISNRVLAGSGSSASSFTSTQYLGQLSIPADTANTFSSHAVYIPNYRGSTTKSYSADSVSENNGTAAWQIIIAGLWSGTAAITEISIRGEGSTNLEATTSASLYGIRKFNTTTQPKATGGAISFDAVNNKWVHVFTASGTFTPTANITCEYLVVAGGGGGANAPAGGGAGGYRAVTGASLTSGTNYSVTVGAGGAGGSASSSAISGSSGSSSSFNSTNTSGGGGGGAQSANGLSGGSGGGGGFAGTGGAGNSGGYSPVEGYAGGNGFSSGPFRGGAGGGSSAVGGNGTSGADAVGGAGTSNSISGTSLVYASGGNGASYVGGAAGVAGANGTSNRGNGGGGGQQNDFAPNNKGGGNGGAGIVIVRYS